MHSNINIETQIRSLTKLLDDLRQGIVQVPPFQRNFVWERDDIKDLLITYIEKVENVAVAKQIIEESIENYKVKFN